MDREVDCSHNRVILVGDRTWSCSDCGAWFAPIYGRTALPPPESDPPARNVARRIGRHRAEDYMEIATHEHRMAKKDAEIEQLKLELSHAAMEINVAGPVDHRIRILKAEKDAELARLREEVERMKDVLENFRALAFLPRDLTYEDIYGHYADLSQIQEMARLRSELARLKGEQP